MATNLLHFRPRDLSFALLALALFIAMTQGCSSSSGDGSPPASRDGGTSTDSAARGDSPPVETGPRGDAGDSMPPACTLLRPGASCTAAHECCQSGPGLPQGQTCFTVDGGATLTCQPRCNTSSECATGTCCIADESSFPAFGSAPTEPGGVCYAEDAGAASCITGNANGYVCTGNDDTGFVCTAATSDGGPTGATCTAGVDAYCACLAVNGDGPCGSLKTMFYAQCINGAPSPFACFAGYQGAADAGVEACAAALKACE
jgi:hypothetical protein